MYNCETRLFVLVRGDQSFVIASEETSSGEPKDEAVWTGRPWFHLFSASLECAEIERIEARLRENWVVRTYLPLNGRLDSILEDDGTPGLSHSQVEVIFTRIPLDVGGPVRVAMAIRQGQPLESWSEDYGLIWRQSKMPQWIYDAETLRFLEVNEAAVETYGYSRDELLSMSVLDIRTPGDLGSIHSPLADLSESQANGPQTKSWLHRTSQGTAINVEISVHQLSFHGRPAYLEEVRNVTRELRTLEHLEEAVQRYYQTLESIHEAFFALNRDWRFVYLNREAERLLRQPREDLLGHSLWDAMPAMRGTRFQQEFEKVLSSGTSTVFEGYYPPTDSWYEVNAYAAKNGLSIFLQDVTGRRRTESRLRTQVDRMTALRTIDSAIVSSLDIRLTLNLIIELTLKHLKGDAASILQLDPNDNALTYVAGRGFLTDLVDDTYLQLGEGYAGQAALERKTLIVEDIEADLGSDSGTHRLAPEGFVSYFGVPLISKGEVRGVLEVFRRSKSSVDKDWVDFLEMLGGQTAIAIDNAALFTDLQRVNSNLLRAYDTTLQGWARALDLRDKETEGHSRRVTDYSVDLARRMGLPPEEVVNVRRGAWLHDIGKMGVPDGILLKPGKLTDEEWVIMKKHPQFAYDLLYPIEFLRPALDIPFAHHEKWDGSGYPRGLAGEQIPQAARIFAIIDVFDALTSDRPYRAAWSYQKAIDYIQEQAGTHFDPAVVEAFNQWAREKFHLENSGE